MDFFYTTHAEEKIKGRKLDKSTIERTVQSPETLLISRFGRKMAQRKSETSRYWSFMKRNRAFI